MLSAMLLGGGCSKDVLDRPDQTKVIDENFWRNEADVRLYANDFYLNYFVGYNTFYGTAYAPLVGIIMRMTLRLKVRKVGLSQLFRRVEERAP